eukprot:sb/3472108/
MPIGRGRARPAPAADSRPPGADPTPRPPINDTPTSRPPITTPTPPQPQAVREPQKPVEQSSDIDETLYEAVFEADRSEAWIGDWALKCMKQSYGNRERCKKLISVMTRLDGSNNQHKQILKIFMNLLSGECKRLVYDGVNSNTATDVANFTYLLAQASHFLSFWDEKKTET